MRFEKRLILKVSSSVSDVVGVSESGGSRGDLDGNPSGVAAWRREKRVSSRLSSPRRPGEKRHELEDTPLVRPAVLRPDPVRERIVAVREEERNVSQLELSALRAVDPN